MKKVIYIYILDIVLGLAKAILVGAICGAKGYNGSLSVVDKNLVIASAYRRLLLAK